MGILTKRPLTLRKIKIENMADNYLERKMEERREGGRQVVRVVSNPTGTLVVRFPFGRALVYAQKPDERTALLLSRLASSGCKMGLASADGDSARRIARARGAMYVPTSDAAAARTMFAAIVGEPEVIFDDSAVGIMASVGDGEFANLGKDVEKALLRLLCSL